MLSNPLGYCKTPWHYLLDQGPQHSANTMRDATANFHQAALFWVVTRFKKYSAAVEWRRFTSQNISKPIAW